MINGKLIVTELSKSFGSNEVLKNISFTVKDGEFLSILGSSGCGKSTILRILIGLETPTAGKIVKDGIDITGLSPSKRGMGIVFQNYALFENMTVLENVEYVLKIKKETKRNSRKTAMDLIERVGLGEHVSKRPDKLSGGQQQRVAIARTLAANPDVILFDEPMSALDADIRLSLRGEIKKIQKEFGSTMIYITHDQEEALSMSDRIMVLNDGVIHQLDTPKNIIENPADEHVRRFVVENIKLKVSFLSEFTGLRL